MLSITQFVATLCLVGSSAVVVESVSAKTRPQNAIEGVWKVDASTVAFEGRLDELLLKDGTYSCISCTPSYTFPADGVLHPVSAPFYDAVSVRAINDHKVERIFSKNGKQTSVNTLIVSPDDQNLTYEFSDSPTVAGAPAKKGVYFETRVGSPVPAAHVLSGQWKRSRATANNASFTMTFHLEGDRLRRIKPNGQFYDAKLDGSSAPIMGDSEGTTVSVTRLGENSFQEMDSRQGKVTDVVTFTVDSNDVLQIMQKSELTGATAKYTAARQ